HHADERAGVCGAGDRIEQRRVDPAENRAGGADPECQREDGEQREAGRLAQHADAETEVLGQVVERPDATRVAALLLYLVEASELEPGPTRGGLRREALPDILLDL